jgi:hypothetical protein
LSIGVSKGDLCKICADPNNLLTAAAESRLSLLMQKEKKAAVIMVMTVALFMVCWAPAGIAYSVSELKTICNSQWNVMESNGSSAHLTKLPWT